MTNVGFRKGLAQAAADKPSTTIVSYEEQTRGWLAYMARAKTLEQQIEAYRRLHRHLTVYAAIAMIDFDESAAVEFQALKHLRRRIGVYDLRIASIAKSREATLVTRNTSNFSQVPGLSSMTGRAPRRCSAPALVKRSAPYLTVPKFTDEQRRAWRARREARRAKQRVENVTRAEAMHAARVAAEKAGPLAAPDLSGDSLPRLCIGCSGWYYWHWKGQFYPQELPSSRWFAHYASKFNTVELNAPFYSWPTVSTVKTWLRQAGRKRFVYTIKVSELITHTKRFRGTKTLICDFGFIADLLGRRMGCLLFQLPPSFRYSPAALERIISQLDQRRRNVVEFRHRSWWNDAVYDAFRQAGIIFCSTSGPRLPDQLVKTTDEIYIRFHGAKRWYRHDYTKEELQTWADRIRSSGAQRVWAYFNNDREGHAIKNARTLRRILKG